MIQPVKKLRILSLTVKGFKGFSEETAFTFGDLNTITGHNGQGKSSIADAIAWHFGRRDAPPAEFTGESCRG